MTQTLTIHIPPGMWLTANQRPHWAAKAAATRSLRDLAHAHAAARHLRPAPTPARVVAHIHLRTGARFDPANASPTTKALVDGLTDAGLWPDDDAAHVIGPDHRLGAPMPALRRGWHAITLTIEEDR